MMMIIFLLLVFIGSILLTWYLKEYAIKNSLIDVPNQRSSHAIPTPRGGGVAIVITFLIAQPILYTQELLTLHEVIGFMGAGILIAAIGFWDDHGHISAGVRLLFHFLAAFWGLYWLGGLAPLVVFYNPVDFGLLGIFFAAIYLVWLLNLYNFMDGIDGIASIEAISVCIGTAILYFIASDSNQWIILATLVASVSGFLIWNFPPAKIFMGDAGSGFLGLMIGLLSIQSISVNSSLFVAWLILLGVFIVDATLTLLYRILQKKKIYEAHRSHAYQYASRKLKSHKIVSLSIGLINIFWLLPLAYLTLIPELNKTFILIIAYIPLIILAIYFKAGNSSQNV